MKSFLSKIFIGLVLISLMSYAAVEIFGGRIITSNFQDVFKDHKISVDDIDLNFLKGEVILDHIEIVRESGFKIGVIETLAFAPRWKDKTLFFKTIRLEDAHLNISAADVPENVNKKSELWKIKPRFQDVILKNVIMEIPGVKGLSGDKVLTLRKINGLVDCEGEVLCLKNQFKLTASPIRGTLAKIDGSSDIRAVKKLHARGEIQNIHLNVFNSILTSASPVTAKSGRVDLFIECRINGSSGEGYLKFFVDDLELKEKKDSKAGFFARLAGDVLSDRKLDHFDARVPVKIVNNRFSLEKVDLKNEIKRIVAGRMLPKGFDTDRQAQEAPEK